MSLDTAAERIDILVVGGGAAGMLAAVAAREAARKLQIPDRDCSIVILERNAAPGAKIRISGGGRCNVTHSGTPGELLAKGFLRREEERFLRHALYAFTGSDLVRMLALQGVQCEARPDGKVFPAAGLAAPDIVQAFGRLMREARISVEASCTVSSVERVGVAFIVKAEERRFDASSLILATGGVSYPSTGSRGDGLLFARRFGHTIVKPSPALAPIITHVKPPGELAGVSLRAVRLIGSAAGKQVSRCGDVLFTHRGLSGPAVLSLSRDIAELFRGVGSCDVFVDLFPGLRPEELQEQLLRESGKNGSRMVRKFLQSCPIAPPDGVSGEAPNGTIPSALVPFIMRLAGLSDDLQWSGLTRDKRTALLETLRRFPAGSVKTLPLDQGEISAGGISLREVNPKTMESRLVPGLYFAGEILDYAGEIGGFNLQAAFSTGWLAGESVVGSRQEDCG